MYLGNLNALFTNLVVTVDINKKAIPPKLNFPSSIRATATPFSISALSQPFPSSINANKDLTYPNNINTFPKCSRVKDGLT